MDHVLNEPPQILGKCPVLVSAVKDSPALRAVAWYQNPSIGDLCTMDSYKIFYTTQLMFIFSPLRVVTCQSRVCCTLTKLRAPFYLCFVDGGILLLPSCIETLLVQVPSKILKMRLHRFLLFEAALWSVSVTAYSSSDAVALSMGANGAAYTPCATVSSIWAQQTGKS